MPGTAASRVQPGQLSPGLARVLGESAARAGARGQPDPDALAVLRDCGVLGVAVPRQYGGAGGDARAVNGAVEQLAYLNPSISIIAFQHFAVCSRVVEWGTADQQARLLPRLADGTCLAASAWSEPGAGAAKRNLSSTGRREPDGSWVLDGTKSFTTGASIADVYLVLVRTGPAGPADQSGYGAHGQTFFLVDRDTPGLAPRLGLDLVGMTGSATGMLALRRCVVSDRDRLGPEGGAAQVIAGVRESGATLGAVALGAARAAVDLLVDHLRRRGQLASPVLRDRLVDLETRLESVRALVERAGARSSTRPGLTTLHSKLYASTEAEEICLAVSRLLGSAGLVATSRINQLLNDVRAVAMMGPTNDLCRELVAAAWQR